MPRPVTFLFALLLAAALAWSPVASAQTRAAAPALVEGTDYIRIPGGKPYQPVAGKVEVVEVFGYWCPHCAHFEPKFAGWKAKQPADVNVLLLPATFDPNDAYAKGYFAAQRLGIAQRAHASLFRAIHEDLVMPRNATDEEVAAYYARFGVPAAKMLAAMRSPATTADIKRTTAFLERANIEGTPSVIVDGQFLALGRSHEDLLRITQQLVARQRAAGRR